MNVQYAIQGDEIYVLEVNPRASRTVPFVAKATSVPVAKIAARVMAGEPLGPLRADGAPTRARGGQGGGAALRPLPGQRRHPRPRDEIDRRVHGHRSGLRDGLPEGPARRGSPPAAIRERAALRARCRQARCRRCGSAPRASRLPPPGDPRNRGVPASRRGPGEYRGKGRGRLAQRPGSARSGRDPASDRHRSVGGRDPGRPLAADAGAAAPGSLLFAAQHRPGHGGCHRAPAGLGAERTAAAVLRSAAPAAEALHSPAAHPVGRREQEDRGRRAPDRGGDRQKRGAVRIPHRQHAAVRPDLPGELRARTKDFRSTR